MRIGFAGLGMMGYPMASRLAAAGFPMVVSDLNTDAVSRFLDAHPSATRATSPDDLSEAGIMITMLPDSDTVEAVILGTGGQPGVAGTMKRGAVFIDMSSSEPLRSRALGETLLRRGLRYLDAPVSGGVKRAIDGSLAIMAGGDAALVEECRGVLAAMGKTIRHVGANGAGHAMKALNNYVSAAGLVAAVDALHAGQAFGLDPDVMVDVLNQSTGRNNTTENKARQFMLSGAFNSGFSLGLMAKDLGIAAGLARSISQPLALGDAVLQLWQEASEQLGPGADHTEMYRYLKPGDRDHA